ncbi:MAG: M6 family metalloprotease domain-containing protein [Bacteroidales bacterium]|nr:M6 family metalloprotease domain-containing protein [Candidatus Cryptobacteroides aphodequi]
MKRFRLIAVLAAALAFQAPSFAIKAPSRPVQYTQPDGSVIEIFKHGDEFHHWTTDASGRVMVLGDDGFWHAATGAMTLPSPASTQKRLQHQAAVAARAASPIAEGKHKFLVILVQFSDLKFTLSEPQQAFTNLLNQPGYSKNGGTGSAYDFYRDNSNKRFDPEFIVAGPYTVSKGYASYGANDPYTDEDVNPDGAFYEACCLADSEIDFSEYDLDGDGYVDNIFFYYAGYNEAEGASENTIWPHQWEFYNYSRYKLDGVRLGSYACTSEYRGTSGKIMCGIGTFCHEFGHVIGLPDFYDTDYEENGYYEDPVGYFSTMDGGSYLNDGCTPPYFSAMERSIIGWTDEPAEIEGNGTHTLEPVHKDAALKYSTSNSGEYFIFECRDNTGWDAYIPSGLLVYHVDKSSNKVSGRITAASLWAGSNSINAYSSHPCYYIVRSKKSSYFTSPDYFPYPGRSNVTTFSPVMWSKSSCELSLTGIAFSGGKSSFTVSGLHDSGGDEEDWGDGDDTKIRELGYSYIRPDGAGGYELVPGKGLTVASTKWTTTTLTVSVTVTYTNGSTDVIELDL